jgi:hypothetical protein
MANAIEWHIVGLYIQPPGTNLNVFIWLEPKIQSTVLPVNDAAGSECGNGGMLATNDNRSAILDEPPRVVIPSRLYAFRATKKGSLQNASATSG